MKHLDQLLTVIFLLLAVAAMVFYFVTPGDRTLFWIIGGVAVLLRVAQYVIRMVSKQKAIKARREDLLKDIPEPTYKEE